jgi:membrane fusion protein, heavy metal efflux system
MKINNYKGIIVLMIIIFTSCSHDPDVTTEINEYGGTSITQYTDSTEIFMEYPALLVGQDAKFLIHLSDMKDFKAVNQGILNVEFTNSSGTNLSLKEDKPTRAGIYTPVVKFKESGNYTMSIMLSGSQVSDRIVVNNVIVYSSENEIPQDEESSSSSISFLKEQQWKIDFANEPVIKRKIQKSVIATGEIKPKPELFSKVVSPIEGIVLSKNNGNLKSVGSFVKAGEILLNLSPTANASTNIQKIKNDFLLAKSEYERATNLLEKKAISKKRFDEAKFDFESNHASYNSLLDQINITEKGYSVISPISGYIENINFNLGDQTISGQELFTIINPNRLLLKANIPSSNFEIANNSQDASFKVEGSDYEYVISLLNGRKQSVSASLNKENRTIPVYFEFNNPQNKLKVGMYAEVFVKTGDLIEGVTVPESAIINEDGLHTAYVQIEGELFEKRILETGIIDGGYVQVFDGLKVGERVVTIGAYQVRLAALSPESAIGQGHVH